MNIYVGNLSLGITEGDLQKAFETFGAVETVRVIKDAYTGRSKGFGFVEMPDGANAKSAIDGLDGTEMQGRTLKVNTARPRSTNRGGRGGYSGGRKGGRQGGGRRF
jgi:RNA recognition motif-containing protein